MFIESIGLGMVVSFFMTETIGLAAGGIVVPGYIAVALSEPLRVVSTVILGLVTFFITKILGNFVLLYGRRLLVLAVILGYLLGYITKIFPPLIVSEISFDFRTIGYVIPGLIAYWMHRQGIVETLSTMVVASVLTRLIIIILSRGAIGY